MNEEGERTQGGGRSGEKWGEVWGRAQGCQVYKENEETQEGSRDVGEEEMREAIKAQRSEGW